MKKTTLVILSIVLLNMIFIALFNRAHAADFEVGLGKSEFTVNAAWSVGITDQFDSGLRWHFGFADLGKPLYSSDATPNVAFDDNYPAGTKAHWTPARDNIELYATVTPTKQMDGWALFADVGGAVYRQTWYMEIPYNIPAKYTGKTHYKFTPVLGVGAEVGRYSVEAMVQHIAADGDFDDKTFHDIVYTLMVKTRF